MKLLGFVCFTLHFRNWLEDATYTGIGDAVRDGGCLLNNDVILRIIETLV